MKGFRRVMALGGFALLATACSSDSPVGMESGLDVASATSFTPLVVGPLPLTVEKTAVGTYDKTVTWELTKTASPVSHGGAPGDEFLSNWTVTATKSEVSDNYEVTGNITVSNPNPFPVDFTLADVLNDGTAADITCPGTGDNTGTAPAAAGAVAGTVVCSYSATPPDGSATLNTVTVTVNDVGLASTTAGATAEDTEPVSFTANVIGDNSVTLSDPRVAYNNDISTTTIVIFPENFACPADPLLYTNGVYTETFTNTAYLDGPNTDLEASAGVRIRCQLPPSGGQGCTPGFWRQKQHLQYWKGFDPSDLYADVFGVDRAGTLLQNVKANGGRANALARHSVAALLNATNAEVDYDLTIAQIIAGVQAAYASGDFETFKNVLERFNEQGCSVNKSK